MVTYPMWLFLLIVFITNMVMILMQLLGMKYYYPILYKNEIVLVASIINTTNGWTLSASDEIIDGLKKINYKDNSSLFYELDDCILAVSNEETKVIQSDEKEKSLNYNKKEKKFEEISSIEKASEILENIDNMKPVDIKQIQFSTQNNNIKEEYTPLFSEDRNSGSDYIKVCSLYNKQGQGSLPICWAASIATIVNYRLGTNYTAKDICDNEGLEYKGANIDTKQQALKTYGLFYDKMTSQLSWELIVKNINNKYLIAASTFDGRGNGHSITVYGYKFTNANKYIVLHNPGTNDTQIVLYKTGGSTYTYNNKTWTWTKSLYYYR